MRLVLISYLVTCICLAILLQPIHRTNESSTPYPSIPLTLSQHRVAWHEQLVLRVANVPHVVLNSSYLASETTGQLPYLRDVGSISANSANTDDDGTNRPPALVGRRNPGGLLDPNPEVIPSGSHIVDYLRSSSYSPSAHNIINLDEHLDDVQKADGLAYSTMITQTLNTVIAALRYGDYRAWEEVYRHQSITACLDPNGTDAANGSNTAAGILQLGSMVPNLVRADCRTEGAQIVQYEHEG